MLFIIEIYLLLDLHLLLNVLCVFVYNISSGDLLAQFEVDFLNVSVIFLFQELLHRVLVLQLLEVLTTYPDDLGVVRQA